MTAEPLDGDDLRDAVGTAGLDPAALREVPARADGRLWPDTCGLPGVTVRDMARDLVGRDRWFLHLRP